MNLDFVPTKRGGGVKIDGDERTLHLIERLITKHAMNSKCCFEDGVCMTLSRYFEKDRSKTVDWVTLYYGVTVLRSSMGYFNTREEEALISLLEFLVEKSLASFLKESEQISDLFYTHKGYTDLILDGWESRMVYLYLLKTATQRRKELLRILTSFDPIPTVLDKDYVKQFKELHIGYLDYGVGEKFEYVL